MSNANISLNKNMAFLLIAMLSTAVIVGFDQFSNVNALNNYFNCTTKKANGDSNFGIQEAFTCYDSVFKGARIYANETYQNPDMSNLTAIKDVVNEHSKTSVVKPAATTTTNGNAPNSMVKPSNDGDKLIIPIKLNDDLKTKHVSKAVPDEKPNAPDTTNLDSEKSAKSNPDFQLNSDQPSSYDSFDLPFSAVIPK